MNATIQKPLSILKTFLDIVLPPVCYVCGRGCSSEYGLCEGCLEQIKHIPSPQCPKCGRRLAAGTHICPECRGRESSIEKAWSCCNYEGVLKECLHLFKYRGYAWLADIFGDIMVDFVRKNEIDKEIDILVPVPVYTAKKRERGFNHAEVLARYISKNILSPCDAANLKKIKWTQSQSELDKEKRLKNVRDAFVVVDKKVFIGKKILLVDDIYTTGATLNECAKTLLGCRADKVFSLTLARGA